MARRLYFYCTDVFVSVVDEQFGLPLVGLYCFVCNFMSIERQEWDFGTYYDGPVS